ncbi:MAG: dihydropteroate synthase, partial [Verrucomicrobiota bacterium]
MSGAMVLRARGRELDFARRPLVMGIVNLSADSFSGDGLSDAEAALAHAERLIADGADIIDVGAESARTNRGPISVLEETERLCGFVELWKRTKRPQWLSLNTWRPEVARDVLALGGELLNDIGALPDAENARICAETGAALLIMHSVGEPKVAHTHVGYEDVLETLERFFEEKLAQVAAAGLEREAVVLDPGIDFAKQKEDNLRIYAHLDRLHRFGRPVLLPVSRKTVIGQVLGIADPAQRDAGTVACIVAGMLRGAHIF